MCPVKHANACNVEFVCFILERDVVCALCKQTSFRFAHMQSVLDKIFEVFIIISCTDSKWPHVPAKYRTSHYILLEEKEDVVLADEDAVSQLMWTTCRPAAAL